MSISGNTLETAQAFKLRRNILIKQEDKQRADIHGQLSAKNENNKDLFRLTFGCLYEASAWLIWGQEHRSAQSSEVTSWGWYQTHHYHHLPWLWRNYCYASGDTGSPRPSQSLDNPPTHPEAPAGIQTHSIKACSRTRSERILHLSSHITSSCLLNLPHAANFPPIYPSPLARNSRNSLWLYY